MEVLKELVRNIVVIVMLTAFLDMILPSSSMRPYVKMVMGLFILVTLLNPVLNLILHDREFEVFAWQEYGATATGNSTVQHDSERLLSVNQKLFMENYGRRLEIQMESLAKLVEGVDTVRVGVELQGSTNAGFLEGIESVVVTVTCQEEDEQEKDGELVSPVKIQLNDRVDLSSKSSPENDTKRLSEERKLNNNKKIMEKEIKKMLCQYFGLQAQQIRVIFS